MSEEHVCYGAECITCSPFTTGRITFSPDATGDAVRQTRFVPALGEIVVRAPMDAARAARLATFRDSRGESLSTWPQQVGVGTAVIIIRPAVPGDGQEVLVQQRSDNGWWAFPGGRMDAGESVLECARREVREETGLDIQLDGLVAVDSDPTQYAICVYSDAIVHYLCCTFIAHVTGGRLTCSQESQALLWCAPHELPQPFLPSHQWRLEMALRHTHSIPVR